MSIAIQDTIEREITISAPIERVFRSLTVASELTGWFPQGVEGNIEPGETVVWDFGRHGKVAVLIVAVESPTYFAYRWVPGSVSPDFQDISSRATTLVEFRLREVDGGTMLSLVESGFASLPAEEIAGALSDNSEGWTEELAKLVEFAERS